MSTLNGDHEHDGAAEVPAPRIPLQPLGASFAAAAAAMRHVPVVGGPIAAAQDEWGRVENLIWRQVRERMDTTDDDTEPPGRPQQMLAALLSASVEQSAAQARERLLVRLLSEIEPDEARILAALSDGTTFPVVHVVTKGAFGQPGARLLENVSSIGRRAGVALPDYTPIYVARLRRLGLVVVGPAEARHADDYEILATETLVHEAQTAHDSPTRLLHRTLTLSPLGRDLWDITVAG